jgi:hypothetical protein
MTYRLLEAFESVFTGKRYLHRNQGIGNFVASHLYEDLLDLGRSAKLVDGIIGGRFVVNTSNLVKGRTGRRGDGTFGELIPGEEPNAETGFNVRRGPVATLLVGAEVKIVAKAMMKQIDRVMTDLLSQAITFKQQTKSVITIAIVGVNYSESYVSYESDRNYPAKPAPSKEAPAATQRVLQRVAPAFDELLILRFPATNVSPYPFEWVDAQDTRQSYGAALLRVNNLIASNLSS